MQKQIVATDKAPAAIGPYSQAVKAGGFLFCSGQIPLRADGSMVEAGVQEQTRQVMRNLAEVVAAAGSDLNRVVKTTIYLVDMADFAIVNEIYAESFGEHPPARATVQVAGLPKGAMVEIDAIVSLS